MIASYRSRTKELSHRLYYNYINAGEHMHYCVAAFKEILFVWRTLSSSNNKLIDLIYPKGKTMRMDCILNLGNIIRHNAWEFRFSSWSQNQRTIFEIVFKTGKLISVYEDALLLETMRRKSRSENLHPLQLN